VASSKASFKGVLFDVDGTLVNSNDAHARAWIEAMRERGLDVPFRTVRAAIGMGGDKLLPSVAGIDADSPLGRLLSERRGHVFRTQFLPALEPFSQARGLLGALRAKGLKLAVASSAERSELEALLAIAQVTDLLETATSSSDAEHSKPDPDIVGAALRGLDLAPEQVIMVGDTPYDIEAASRAGVGTIALRCGGKSDHDLLGALAIYDDPADLLSHLHSAPLFMS
jgi:HAD superfamily hydrolase (TIGR01509 family)